MPTPGHGDGTAILQAAVGYYNSIKRKLENRPTEDLERIVRELNPSVDRVDINTWKSLGIALGTGIVAGIFSEIPQTRDFGEDMFFYSFLPALLISFGTIYYGGTGRRLENRYTRDAAQSILSDRC